MRSENLAHELNIVKEMLSQDNKNKKNVDVS
jgi:hypothetical protein